MTTDITHPLPEGTLVRLTRNCDDGEESRWPAGTEFTINEYVEPRAESEREPDEITAPIYYGDINGGVNNIWAPADAIEVVKTAAEMAARTLPTVEQIAQELGITDGWSDAFEIDEWIRSGNEIECYAKTGDGLPFGFQVRVTRVWETDL